MHLESFSNVGKKKVKKKKKKKKGIQLLNSPGDTFESK
jgi:hypothetical protein